MSHYASLHVSDELDIISNCVIESVEEFNTFVPLWKSLCHSNFIDYYADVYVGLLEMGPDAPFNGNMMPETISQCIGHFILLISEFVIVFRMAS